MFTRSLLFLGVAGSALFLLPGDCADAGCRHVQVVQQLQAAVQYQPVYTPYLYSVGSNLQTQASEERIANLVIQKLNAQQLTTSANNSQTSHNLPAPQTLPLTAEADRWANMKQGCGSCHTTNSDAMSHIDANKLSELTCEQKINAIKQMMEGKMPPPGKDGKPKLTEYQLGQIIGEIVGANNVSQP